MRVSAAPAGNPKGDANGLRGGLTLSSWHVRQVEGIFGFTKSDTSSVYTPAVADDDNTFHKEGNLTRKSAVLSLRGILWRANPVSASGMK